MMVIFPSLRSYSYRMVFSQETESTAKASMVIMEYLFMAHQKLRVQLMEGSMGRIVILSIFRLVPM